MESQAVKRLRTESASDLIRSHLIEAEEKKENST